MLRPPLPALALSSLLFAGCAAALPEGPDPAGDPSPAAGELPGWLRPIVRTQMARQRAYVNELRWTAASLEFERTSALARRIGQEVQCGRPADGSASLDVVPPRYLDLQERLRERAYRLSQVAASGSSHQVASAYRSMLEICTRCHAVYRPGPPVELPLMSSE
jgi:hypothetical protein